MRKSYKKLILNNNIKKFSLIIKDNINMFLSIKIPTQANKNTVLQINFLNNAKKIKKVLKQHIEKNELVKRKYN